MLKNPKRRMDWIRNKFDVPGTVYDRGAMAFRERQRDEYPEWDAIAWSSVYEQAQSAITEMTAISTFAREQYWRVKNELKNKED